MRRHIIGSVVLGVTAAVFALNAWMHTFATIQDKGYQIGNVFICAVVFIVAFIDGVIEGIMRRVETRSYFMATALAAVLVAAISIVGTRYRINATKHYLAKTYATLAANGPPFPSELPDLVHGTSIDLISHGYWVAEDRKLFEVYYHDGSDSFTKVYPTGQWDWRSNKYAGPDSEHE
ncbi:hypothetical protein CA54_20520 [Symmachiella macrocystis]|uniref:Uncharacterized protein n=1 Tax=Symmachiella macrocystis TaxID=2527985 RepID=A0A5C6BM60_9PLAN|nr:hypothetical protein [Symmachiella macrocystis]TWU13220.1 hypothetical protein CA54_20520 [Symmachiella macrocystis]